VTPRTWRACLVNLGVAVGKLQEVDNCPPSRSAEGQIGRAVAAINVPIKAVPLRAVFPKVSVRRQV
jgi:hypothetical protein